MTSDAPSARLDPAAVSAAEFGKARKGYDREQVRAYLAGVARELDALSARERELLARVAELEARAVQVQRPDASQLTAALGEEAARVLNAAREAADERVARADSDVARLRAAADEYAVRTRGEADEYAAATRAAADEHNAEVRAGAEAAAVTVRDEADQYASTTRSAADEHAGSARSAADEYASATRVAADDYASVTRAAADDDAARVRAAADEQAAATRVALDEEVEARRRAAEAEAEAIVGGARAAFDAEVEAGRAQGAALVAEAEIVRERVLRDLGRRRKVLRVQIEQLRAAHDRIVTAHDDLRRLLDAGATELDLALPAARGAAEAAGRRVEAEPELSIDQLEDEITMARLAGLPLVVDVPAPGVLEPLTGEMPALDLALGPAPAAAEASARGSGRADEGLASEPAPLVADGGDEVEPDRAEGADEVEPDRVEGADEVEPHRTGEPGTATGAHPTPSAEAGPGHAAAPSDADDAETEADDVVEPTPAGGADDAPAPTVGDEVVLAELGGRHTPVGMQHLPRDPVPLVREVAAVEYVRVLRPPPLVEPAAALEPSGATHPTPSTDEPATDDTTAEPATDDATADDASPEAEVAPAATATATDTAEDGDSATAEGGDDRAATPGTDQRGGAVDALFARIRESRSDAVARAHEVLGVAGADAAPDGGAPDGAPVVSGGDDEGEDDDVSPDGVEDDVAQELGVEDDGDGALVARRDARIDEYEVRVARLLKRVLGDEQNDLQDLIRRTRGKGSFDEMVPALDAHRDRYVAAVGAAVGELAATARSFFDLPDAADEETQVVVRRLVETSLVGPLRQQLERAFAETSGDDERIERVRHAYREAKVQRVDPLAREVTVAGFNAAVHEALPVDRPRRWVVDPRRECSADCQDNSLEGAITGHERFPTGDAYPPAHPRCRCLLAPADV